MTGWNGWAVTLNGVTFTTCNTQAEWDALGCAPTTVIEGMDGAPDGLDLPDQRTNDVTYYQRDGVKHFPDFYQPRLITVTGTIGPVDPDDCVDGDCSTVRQLVQEAVQAWKRQCCDTELVVWPDCYATDLLTGLNVYPDGTFDVDDDGWVGDGATVARVTSPVHSGAGSLQITWGTDVGGAESATGPVYTATPGDRFQVSAWLYAEVGEPAPMLGCADAAGVEPVFSDPIISDGTWHYVQLDYTVPANGELAPFVTSSDDTTTGDIAYVDDVEAKLYNPAVDRDLNGPFGVVGKPRVFKYKWDAGHRVADFTARFDAVDQRMYVLDECGTPGYSSCENINPGAQLFSVCMVDGVCFGESGMCFDNEVVSDDSVAPVEITVGGTEKVNPTITFYPPLINPTMENMTTGEFVELATTLGVDDTPVTVNTEDGTAFDADGNSLTHLLRGSLFLSMFPGNYTWRLISNGAEDFEDPGYASICWRSTVVSS